MKFVQFVCILTICLANGRPSAEQSTDKPDLDTSDSSTELEPPSSLIPLLLHHPHALTSPRTHQRPYSYTYQYEPTFVQEHLLNYDPFFDLLAQPSDQVVHFYANPPGVMPPHTHSPMIYYPQPVVYPGPNHPFHLPFPPYSANNFAVPAHWNMLHNIRHKIFQFNTNAPQDQSSSPMLAQESQHNFDYLPADWDSLQTPFDFDLFNPFTSGFPFQEKRNVFPSKPAPKLNKLKRNSKHKLRKSSSQLNSLFVAPSPSSSLALSICRNCHKSLGSSKPRPGLFHSFKRKTHLSRSKQTRPSLANNLEQPFSSSLEPLWQSPLATSDNVQFTNKLKKVAALNVTSANDKFEPIKSGGPKSSPFTATDRLMSAAWNNDQDNRDNRKHELLERQRNERVEYSSGVHNAPWNNATTQHADPAQSHKDASASETDLIHSKSINHGISYTPYSRTTTTTNQKPTTSGRKESVNSFHSSYFTLASDSPPIVPQEKHEPSADTSDETKIDDHRTWPDGGDPRHRPVLPWPVSSRVSSGPNDGMMSLATELLTHSHDHRQEQAKLLTVTASKPLRFASDDDYETVNNRSAAPFHSQFNSNNSSNLFKANNSKIENEFVFDSGKFASASGEQNAIEFEASTLGRQSFESNRLARTRQSNTLLDSSDERLQDHWQLSQPSTNLFAIKSASRQLAESNWPRLIEIKSPS